MARSVNGVESTAELLIPLTQTTAADDDHRNGGFYRIARPQGRRAGTATSALKGKSSRAGYFCAIRRFM